MDEIRDLLIEELRDLLSAEHQLVKALPKMAKAAHGSELRDAFETHLEQTKNHVVRLEKAFDLLGLKPKAKTCKGMTGLVEEGAECIGEGKELEDYAADLSLVIAAQKVEHYEISGYGNCRILAERIGEDEVARLLQQTQTEEVHADKLLTQVSQPLLKKAA